VDGKIPEDGRNTRWDSQKQIAHPAKTIRDQQIPCSLFSGANSWWTIRTSFEFPAEIPDPPSMFALLKKLNFKVELWQRCAIVEGDYPVYREAERRGYLVPGLDGKPMICETKYGGPSALVDLTNPSAVKWWQALTSEKNKLGVDSWFMDSASSGFIEAYPEALELQFHNGMTGRELDNYYGPLYLKAVWEVLKEDLKGKRAVVSCRHQAYFAAGRYPYQSLGDRGRQSPPETRVRYALNNGLSGIPFWSGAGFGCMGPSMMSDEEKIRFIPFTYSYWREASQTGYPLIRAMFLEYPDDPECYRTDTQFMYGKEFLIAPVLAEGDQWRNVYLPAGEWVDYWTREKYLGPGWKYIHVGRPPREQTDITGFTWTPVTRGAAPVLVRGGSIIPVGPSMEWVGQKQADPLTLDIYPNGESSFSLYEDDGETYAYGDGAYSITEFKCVEDGGGITVEIGPAEGNYEGKLSERDYVLQVQVTTRPSGVKVGSKTLPEMGNFEAWTNAPSGWYYKMGNNQIGDRTLYVKLPTVKTDRGATVRLEGAAPIRYYRR
jgi:alpha-glucosidase (family GH31 glycosyl hydrolase)